MFVFTIASYYSISLFLGGIIALISGLLPYLDDSKKSENKAWLLLNVSSAIWSFSYYSMIIATNSGTGATSNLILHGAAVFVPLFYFLFVLHLVSKFKENKDIFFTASFISFFFLVISPSAIFIKDVIPKFIFNYAPEPGPLYLYFTIYFFSLVTYSIFLLYQAQQSASKEEALKIRFVLFSSLAGFIGGGGVFLLTYDLLPPYLLVLFALYPAIISYAMVKHQFLEIKVIVTELFIALLWLLLLFRVFAFENFRDQAINVGVFIVSLVLGIFVIKSVTREVESREKLEVLTKKLKHANARLKELDQQKSEFLSIATHQLRGPLAGIRGHLSLIIDGSYGKVPKRAQDVIQKVFSSSGLLAQTINDFLNVSRIEQGSMQYDMKSFELNSLVEDIQEELAPLAKKRKLELSFTDECKGKCFVHADYGKLSHIFFNLIDNAIKYTEKGWIKIRTTVDVSKNIVRTEISDSGIGLSEKEIGGLFEKFVRASGASSVNVNGTGLGLYVARQMVEAHKGKVWVESKGKGNGSTFIVELPIVSPTEESGVAKALK